MRPISLPILLLLAVALTGTFFVLDRGDAPRDPTPISPPGLVRISPYAASQTPEIWFRQPVLLRGEVSAVGERGRFALTGPRGAVLVQPEPGVRDVRRGDRVAVYGTVDYVSRAAAGDRPLGPVRTAAGEPVVSADHIAVDS